ncbi:universal stress protein [Megalodesulfovibrio gigas]|uniref:Putative UspA domain protein n=1 Tax=Megalodesulfovibrio gigas (strain ATCC 19364 / DSM 1382 / NCIMB 9332 / VKM B-1759) TaxID=1121448 RepID=T2GAC7_MEGG1|nr:universal stress protein [Megalodesulfovibrio gigas]AGW13056.1 putative UspA domain protein [Megalodesulfovibrio gigas DSM 1382 = ATCC 19364]
MNAKNILLAVDGSDNSMRAVRYTGAMVGTNPTFRVRLLHVERLPERDTFADDASWRHACLENREIMQAFLAQARQALLEGGLPAESVTEQYVAACNSPHAEPGAPFCSRGSSVSLEILRHMEQDDFGTVVIGRRGLSKAEEFIFGSVSNKIMHLAKGCTVWVVA